MNKTQDRSLDRAYGAWCDETGIDDLYRNIIETMCKYFDAAPLSWWNEQVSAMVKAPENVRKKVRGRSRPS